MSSADLLSNIVGLVLLGALLFSLVVGGRTEHLGVAIFVANVVGCQIARAAGAPVLVLGTVDVATAAAYGVLALRNPEKLWPGVAGVATTFVMVFSATRAIGFPLSEIAYNSALNLAGLLVQASLVAGAWSHRWGPARPGRALQPA